LSRFNNNTNNESNVDDVRKNEKKNIKLLAVSPNSVTEGDKDDGEGDRDDDGGGKDVDDGRGVGFDALDIVELPVFVGPSSLPRASMGTGFLNQTSSKLLGWSDEDEQSRIRRFREEGGSLARQPSYDMLAFSQERADKNKQGQDNDPRLRAASSAAPSSAAIMNAARLKQQDKKEQGEQQVVVAAAEAATTTGKGHVEKPEEQKAEVQKEQHKQQQQKGQHKDNPNFGKQRRMSRAERKARAMAKKGGGQQQQANQQAAAKQTKAQPKQKQKAASSSSTRQSKPMQFDDKKRRAKAQKRAILELKESEKQVALFSHLRQVDRRALEDGVGVTPKMDVHPAIMRLGLKLADGTITGSNARCLAMLIAFKEVVRDYKTPANKHLGRDFNQHVKPYIQFLSEVRPLSVNMSNTINWLKMKVLQLDMSLSEADAKQAVTAALDDYINRRIIAANHYMSTEHGEHIIRNGDVVLTFGSSSSVENIVLHAHRHKKFRMIVVDAGPQFAAKELMRRLVRAGVPCTYLLLNAVSYIMKDVTKVLIGAYAMLSNGHATSPAGTASVAMVAHAYHVPVIVACELYKFCDRVQLDSICFNELDVPDRLVGVPLEGDVNPLVLNDWRSIDNLRLLNLLHDLTPSQFITMILTESGPMPPTSVPVVIREMLN
jgi:translation initiation factor eIF-2B subunit delta